MEIRLDLRYEQLLFLAKQLPSNQLLKLKNDLESIFSSKQDENDNNNFQKLLLKGPVMTDEQHNLFLENRKSLCEWRKK